MRSETLQITCIRKKGENALTRAGNNKTRIQRE
jgi:hypothetical protein